MEKIALLDLCDSNLQLWREGERVQSPGYALWRDGQYRFGTAARAAARLHPREINSRFWWQLGTDPLQPALGPARHTADLAHAQLTAIHAEAGQPREVLLAVSGSMQREQLALLLGIVRQCPFAAVGLVHRSVAIGSLFGDCARLIHLELQLHQALLSELDVQDGQVVLRRSRPLQGYGLLPLQERLVDVIASAFVRQTRFDPRRRAATEQALYDALHAALRKVAENGEASIEVNGYRARIASAELRSAGDRLAAALREVLGTLGADDRLLADPAALLLPGLREALPGMEALTGDEVGVALAQHAAQLVQHSEALAFVTALPALAVRPRAVSESPTRPATTAHAPPAGEPTHLLQGGRARRLHGSGTAVAGSWEVFRDARGWQLRGHGAAAAVNGSAYRDGQILATGDAIAIGAGAPALLINVEA